MRVMPVLLGCLAATCSASCASGTNCKQCQATRLWYLIGVNESRNDGVHEFSITAEEIKVLRSEWAYSALRY